MEPRGTELITRYKHNYMIPVEAEVTEQLILAHWELEKHLTQKMLKSSQENRWEVFDDCYTHLYKSLAWRNHLTEQNTSKPPSERFGAWKRVIGSPPLYIYEIGSGKGEMINYLAKSGFQCKGTEITRERGEKYQQVPDQNLSWGVSDGIHLDRFEMPGSYDVVISDQVIEHFHPEDLEEHMKSVYNILNSEGRYIFSTPHCITGPHDISRVFKCKNPKGMHLKEYTYNELVNAAQKAGFHTFYHVSPFRFKKLPIIGNTSNIDRFILIGILYLRLVLVIEQLLIPIPLYRLRRSIALTLKKTLVFTDNIFLAVQK